jgi:hypothetical protein
MKFLIDILPCLGGFASIEVLNRIEEIEPVLKFAGQTAIGILTIIYIVLKIIKLNKNEKNITDINLN